MSLIQQKNLGFLPLILGGRPLLSVYFPIGDPKFPIQLIDLYVACGVDVIEFGWPALDPYLDGPDIRSSMDRARDADPKAYLKEITQLLARRAKRPKALLMTYAEPMHPILGDTEMMGGIDSILVVGSPTYSVRRLIEKESRKSCVAISTFIELPVMDAAITEACKADGYVMLQAAHGLTGPRASVDNDNKERISELRSAGVTAPILLGFGISTGAQAKSARLLGADGVVVGSSALRAGIQNETVLQKFLEELRSGLDG